MSRESTLLDLELRLLIARHGKARVSAALSAIGDVDLDVLDTGIREYEDEYIPSASEHEDGSRNRTSHRRASKSIEEMVQDSNPNGAAAKRYMERLAHAYQDKEFLPELRAVKRFLQSRGVQTEKLRSRSDALSTVLRVLAECELEELQALNEEKEIRGSDLGMLTDQILGTTKSGKRQERLTKMP